jgi:hypothetical protein
MSSKIAPDPMSRTTAGDDDNTRPNVGDDDDADEDDSDSYDEEKAESHRPGFKKKKGAIELHKDTKEKEVQLLVGSVAEKLVDIFEAEKWEQHKTLVVTIASVTTAMATFMVMYGLALSVLFAGLKLNIAIATVGFFCYLPLCCTCAFLLCPSKKERDRRKVIKTLHKGRQSDKFLHNMMMDAARAAKPPDKNVRLVAVVRGSKGFARQEVMFLGTTVRSMLAGNFRCIVIALLVKLLFTV